MSAENVGSLKTQRDSLRASLTRFEKFLNLLKDKDNIDTVNLQRRTNGLEPILKQFNKVQSAIEE